MTASSAAGVSGRWSSESDADDTTSSADWDAAFAEITASAASCRRLAEVGLDAREVVERVAAVLREVGVAGECVARHGGGLLLSGTDRVGGVGQLVGGGRRASGPRSRTTCRPATARRRHCGPDRTVARVKYQPSSDAMSSFSVAVSASVAGSPASTASTSSAGRPAALAVSAADRLARRRAT